MYSDIDQKVDPNQLFMNELEGEDAEISNYNDCWSKGLNTALGDKYVQKLEN